MRLGRALPILCFALALATSARADDRERAREAYDRGTEAHKRGEFAQAAADFALADQLAPSPVALRAAIDEALRADDPALGMELVERAKRGAVEGDLAASVGQARTKFAGRAGRVRVKCPQACMATIDGRPLDVQKETWTTAGQHTVVVQMGDDAQQRLVDVKADDTTEVAPAVKTPAIAPVPVPVAPPVQPPAPPFPAPEPSAPPPAEKPAPAPAASGITPVVFWLGVGATAVLGGATALSGIDASNKHSRFVSAGCNSVGYDGCGQASTDGAAAQTRTNVLIGATAVIGVATVVIGALFTRWSSDDPKPAAAWAQPGVFHF